MSQTLQGSSVGPVHAVQALGEDPGDRGLADAAGAAEQVGVGDAIRAGSRCGGPGRRGPGRRRPRTAGADSGGRRRCSRPGRRSRSGWCGPWAPGHVGTLRRAGIGRAVDGRARSRSRRGGRGEPGRFSRAHGGDAYGCCVPALTRFASPHCPGPPRLTPTPARIAEGSIVGDRAVPPQPQDRPSPGPVGNDLAERASLSDDSLGRWRRPAARPDDREPTTGGATMARRLNARPSPTWSGDLPVDQRVLGNGLKALVLPAPARPGRRLRHLLPGRLVRRAGRSVGPGPLRRAHAVQGDRAGSRRGRSTGSPSPRRARPTPRRARTRPTTGSPSPPTAGSWPWRSRPTG